MSLLCYGRCHSIEIFQLARYRGKVIVSFDCISFLMIPVTTNITLSDNEIKVSFTHASGPGGQNVNKVATAVKLTFDIVNSPSLPQDVKKRLQALGGRRVTKEGALIIDARRYRTQERNRQDAVDRLVSLVRNAASKPKPRKRTRPTRASREKRIQSKRNRSVVKQMRQAVNPDSD